MSTKRKGVFRSYALVTSLILLLVSFFIICIFYWLYGSSKQNIQNTWRNEMQQVSRKIEQYMKMPMDAVAFSGVTLNTMLSAGQSHEEALRYLVRETSIYAAAISENNTGVYGYYRGRYLDGSGWEPPIDYKPKERPWYKEALKGMGKIVLVQPFFNLQTNTLMMSVSQLLEDGESVVSMDIFLDSLQTLIEELTQGSIVRTAFVVDTKGFVVAHSERRRVGSTYGKDDPLQEAIWSAIREHEGGRFALHDVEGNYTVICEPVNAGWSAVYILNEGKLYTPLVIVYLASGFFLLFVVTISFSVFLNMSRTQAQAEHLHKEIQAVASIYVAMFSVDLSKDSITPIRSTPEIETALAKDYTNFSKRTAKFAEKLAASQSKDLLTQFMETATLEERLADTSYCTQEFMDQQERWIRLRIITTARDSKGRLAHILLAFESIDEDRKQQEKLRKLSETDLMTGIRNRGSGERLIRRAMAEGSSGMFCLMDADKFKSINDIYGHAVGDKVIKAIADSMKKTFRDSDIIFRLGGDEFSSFSIGVVDKEIASRILDRFFSHINAISIPELQGRKISVSVGVTFYPATHEDTFEAMYQRADSGTYESKTIDGNKATFREDNTI